MRIEYFTTIATVFLLASSSFAWQDTTDSSESSQANLTTAETKTVVAPPTKPVSLEDFFADVSANTSLNSNIQAAGAQRDIRAAEMLELEMRITRKVRGKPQELNLFQLSKVLSLDFHREPLHTRFIELSAQAYHDWGDERPAYLVEQIWQEKEYLRLAKAATETQQEVAKLTKNIAKREEIQFDAEFLNNAKDTFKNGYGVHIEYKGKPPVIGDMVGLTSEDLTLQYVRSPHYPPRGCRVVVKLVFNREGKDSVFAHHGEYQPCAFPTGKLRGQVVVLGGLPEEADATLLVFVASHYNDEQSPPVPISNMLSIPILQKPVTVTTNNIPTIDVGGPTEPPRFSLERN